MIDTFEERMHNLGTFAALYRNLTSFRTIDGGKALSLGLFMLIDLFNAMVSGENLISLDRLIENAKNWSLSMESNELYKIFESLVYEGGYKGLTMEYYDFTQNKTVKIKTHLIDLTTKQENSTQKVYVKLTQEGKDFMLKTLEVYKELRVTMELLFLQEQFRKGAFENANSSAEKIKFAVSAKLEEINNLIAEIKRAPWRVSCKSVQDAYDFTLNQMEMEKKVFEHIFYLLQSSLNSVLEEEKMTRLNAIRVTLLQSRELHSKLLTKYQNITTEVMQASAVNLWQNIINNVNIETKYLDLLLRSSQVDPTVLYLFSSLKPRKSICFSGFFNNPYQKKLNPVVLQDTTAEYQEELKEIENRKMEFIRRLLTEMKNGEVYLSRIVAEPTKLKLDIVFYFHQLKVVRIKEEKILRKAAVGLELNYSAFEVKALEENVHIGNYDFSEFLFQPI